MGIQQSNNKNLKYSKQYGYHELVKGHVIKQYQLSSLEQQLSFKTLVSMYRSFDVPTILPIIQGNQITSQNQYIFLWRLKFKYLQQTLQDQINSMVKQNKKYTEEELLKAIDCILSALMGFKLKKLIHGNLNCQTIFIDYFPFQHNRTIEINKNQSQKVYAISLPLLLNASDVQKVISNKQYHQLYLSPMGLNQIRQEKPKPTVGQRNDVFSLGLVILRMATLSDVTQIYDYQKLQFQNQVLQRKIFYCRKNFSNKFCIMLQKMLSTSERQRPDFQQVFNYFSTLSTYLYTQQRSFSLQNIANENTKSIQKTPPSGIKSLFNLQNQDQNSVKGSLPKFNSNSMKKLQIFNMDIRKQNRMMVQSQELIQNYEILRQSKVSWAKFKKRMDNKIKKQDNTLFGQKN